MVGIQRSIAHNLDSLNRVFVGTTDNLVFSCLEVQDLISFSKTCRDAYHRISSYRTIAYSVDKIFGSYFDEDDINLFRRLQDKTGALISGSTALQFFDRSVFEGSDLDIYVEQRHAGEVTLFLQCRGYEFRPRERQPTKLSVALVSNQVNDPEEYPSRGVAGVFDFLKQEKKIQVISTANCPFEVILSFHSTCVMNLISAGHAFSLYPYPTFVERHALVSHTNKSDKSSVVAKYRERGWRMYSGTYAAHQMRDLNMYDYLRSVGDRYCWGIELPPIPHTSDGVDAFVHCETMYLNSWTMCSSRSSKAYMDFWCYTNGRLHSSYTFAKDIYELLVLECVRVLGNTTSEDDSDYEICKSVRRKYESWTWCNEMCELMASMRMV